MSDNTGVKEIVEKYGQAAALVTKGKTSCCGTAPSLADCCDPHGAVGGVDRWGSHGD